MLPPPQETGPDDQGIKTITSFRRNDKGQVEKVRSPGLMRGRNVGMARPSFGRAHAMLGEKS
jgi:hypothetical protein